MELVRKRRGAGAAIAALAMLFALVAQPIAANAATITVNQTESGHTYTAYQVLDGTVTEDANHTNVRLSNVQWGSAVDGATLLNVLKSHNEANNAVGDTQVYAATSKGGQKRDVALHDLYQNCNDAKDFAAIFDWASDNTALANTIAGIINDSNNSILKNDAPSVTSQRKSDNTGYTLSIDDPGYYFIRDGQESANLYFMQVFNDNKEVAPKTSTPTLEKKVYENTKFQDAGQNNDYGTGFNDTADYSIGDQVPFKLIGTIPEMSAYNNGYQYQFVDTLSTSLDRPSGMYSEDNPGGVQVFLAKNKGDVTYDKTSGQFQTSNDAKDVTGQFAFNASSSNNSMTIAVNVGTSTSRAGKNDLKQVNGIYEGTNDDGTAKRTDYKYVIAVYKAKLNANAAVGQQTINNNTLGDQHKKDTPNVGNVNVAKLQYSNNPNTPTNLGDTDNDYVIVFTYKVQLTKAAADNTATTLQNAQFQLKSGDKVAVINNTTHKFIRWANADDNLQEGETNTLTSAADGKFEVIGLDDGVYSLHETQAPTGYNTASGDWTITVSANTSNGQQGNGAETELTTVNTEVNNTKAVSYGGSNLVNVAQDLVAKDSVQGDAASGTLSATITNTQGFQLPQTGDLGTMLLTIVGILIAAGAVLVAVIRRRAHDEA